MPSPFPGMDPYLEDDRLWPAFQRALVERLCEALRVLTSYEVGVGERLDTAGGEQDELFVEIRRPDGTLVTLVDVVSPANKTTPEGRDAYLATRGDALAEGASVAELDLVTQGEPTLVFSRRGLPHFDYAVTVCRAWVPERLELYTSDVPKRLPRFKLPLAPEDRDALIDLQAVFTRGYDRAGFGDRIDYGRPPALPMSEQTRRRVGEVLREKGFVWEEDIAACAHQIWLAEGCPVGKDREHWERAREQLLANRPS